MANVVAEGAYPYCRLTDQPLSVDEGPDRVALGAHSMARHSL